MYFFEKKSLRKNIYKKKKTTSTFDPAFKCQRPVCRKSRNVLGSEKPSVKLRPACSVKLVFSHDVKGRKSKITAKFRVLERFRFQDTKRIISPEKFRDFRETGTWSFSIYKYCGPGLCQLIVVFLSFRPLEALLKRKCKEYAISTL